MKIDIWEDIHACEQCGKLTFRNVFCSESCKKAYLIKEHGDWIDDTVFTPGIHCLGCRDRVYRIGFCSDSCGRRWAEDVVSAWEYVETQIEGINRFWGCASERKTFWSLGLDDEVHRNFRD